jgi:hypothetical protein
MSMLIKMLPNELILHTLCMLTDIRDIMSILDSNSDIKQIIIKNFDYIIRNIIINNNHSYPQMSRLIALCYKKNISFKYKLPIIENICDFISNVSKNTIIGDFLDLNMSIKKEEEHEDGVIIPLSKSYTDIYKMYYQCRINKKFNHDDALSASIYLEWEQYNKMLFYLRMNFEPSIAIDMALFNEEELMKVNMIMKQKVNIIHAIRAVNELVTDDNITKALDVFKRGIPFESAIDVVVDELTDDEIENMRKLMIDGIDSNNARQCSIYNEENRRIIVYLYRKNVDIYITRSIIELIDYRINGFIELIDNNVDINDACRAVYDESINEEQFNEFINLIKNKIKFNLAFVIAKNFNSAEIIKFMTIIDFGVDADIAYDVVDIFEDNQISEFLKLVSDGYNNESVYDIVLLYNNNQRILCKEFIKNNLSYNLIESYNEEQITKFLKLINEDNIDFNNAKNIIDNEPSAKRLQ